MSESLENELYTHIINAINCKDVLITQKEADQILQMMLSGVKIITIKRNGTVEAVRTVHSINGIDKLDKRELRQANKEYFDNLPYSELMKFYNKKLNKNNIQNYETKQLDQQRTRNYDGNEKQIK